MASRFTITFLYTIKVQKYKNTKYMSQFLKLLYNTTKTLPSEAKTDYPMALRTKENLQLNRYSITLHNKESDIY